MRVGLVVSSNKFTGAAAVAEGWCRALHAAGVDARLLFVGGANLERRLVGLSGQSPASSRSAESATSDATCAHSASSQTPPTSSSATSPTTTSRPYAAGVHRRARLVRAFRRPRHLRRDAFHRALARRIVGAIAPYDAVIPDIEELTRAPVAVVPASVDERFCLVERRHTRSSTGAFDRERPADSGHGRQAGEGSRVRAPARRGRPDQMWVPDPRRRSRRAATGARARAAALGLADRVIWVGKREEDLPDLFCAMDAVCSRRRAPTGATARSARHRPAGDP